MTRTTTFRLSSAERDALDAAANAAGLGPSSFARRTVMAAIGRKAVVRRRPNDVAHQIGRFSASSVASGTTSTS